MGFFNASIYFDLRHDFYHGIRYDSGSCHDVFRDMQFLWGVLSMLWMYLTPLFYPISIVPKQVQGLVLNNPMYYFVNAFRTIILEGITPRPVVFCQCTVVALVMLGIGSLIFKKTQDKFIFYI